MTRHLRELRGVEALRERRQQHLMLGLDVPHDELARDVQPRAPLGSARAGARHLVEEPLDELVLDETAPGAGIGIVGGLEALERAVDDRLLGEGMHLPSLAQLAQHRVAALGVALAAQRFQLREGQFVVPPELIADVRGPAFRSRGLHFHVVAMRAQS
jgi:hypothetical protein